MEPKNVKDAMTDPAWIESMQEELLQFKRMDDIMIIVQNESVVDTSDLQTELERTKERFENCIIKKETEYAKLWNDWINPSKTSREEKHVPNTVSASVRTKPITVSQPHVITKKDVNSDLNGLSYIGVDNTKTRRPQPRSNSKHDRVPSVSKSSRSKNKEAEVEEHHMNLLLFKNNIHISSAYTNTQFAKQPIGEKFPKVGKTNALSKPVTSNSVSSPQEPIGVNNDKTSRNKKHVLNTVSASARTKPITVSQPYVITKKDVNSDLNGSSSTGVDNTKTRRPKPRSNTKHDKVLSASKSSRSKNKAAEIEEHHRNLLLSKNNKHIS
nr:hypothetical protein [Tanacetum cinerariifolium]